MSSLTNRPAVSKRFYPDGHRALTIPACLIPQYVSLGWQVVDASCCGTARIAIPRQARGGVVDRAIQLRPRALVP
jgi:hypothetical protein